MVSCTVTHSFIRLSTLNVTVLMLLSMKNTPLAKLTEYAHDRLNVFHRWVAATAWVQGAIHTFAIGLGTSRLEPDQSYILLHWENICGIAALAVFGFMLVSFPILAKLAYEYFYVIHIILTPIFLATLFLHNYYCRIPVIVAAGLWVLDRLIRIIRFFLNNEMAMKLKATMQITYDGSTLVTVPRRYLPYRAGSHAFLSIPEISRFQSHPFTIASTEDTQAMSEGKSYLQFLIRRRNGFTREVSEMAKTTFPKKKEVVAYIDGPYGGPEDFCKYDRVILIAAGSGISFTLPIALALIRSGSCKSVDFIWTVRTREAFQPFMEQLCEISKMIYFNAATCTVNMQLHISTEVDMVIEHITLPYERSPSQSYKFPQYAPYTGKYASYEGRRSQHSRYSSNTDTLVAIPLEERHYSTDDLILSVELPRGRPGRDSWEAELTPVISGEQYHHDPRFSTRNSEIEVPTLARLMRDIESHWTASRDSSVDRLESRNASPSRARSSERVLKEPHAMTFDTLDTYIITGRPHIKQIISDVAYNASPMDTVAVGVCGLRELTQTVRNAVADNMVKNSPSFSIFCEEFGM